MYLPTRQYPYEAKAFLAPSVDFCTHRELPHSATYTYPRKRTPPFVSVPRKAAKMFPVQRTALTRLLVLVSKLVYLFDFKNDNGRKSELTSQEITIEPHVFRIRDFWETVGGLVPIESEAEAVERRARSELSRGLGTNYVYAGDRYKDDLEPEMPVSPGSLGVPCMYRLNIQDFLQKYLMSKLSRGEHFSTIPLLENWLVSLLRNGICYFPTSQSIEDYEWGKDESRLNGSML